MVQINWVGTDRDNYTAGSFKKVGFILHWMAGGLPGTTGMFRPGGSADYSTGYGIGTANGRGDGPVRIDQYVNDKDRAFGSANPDADRKGISIEMENNMKGPKSPWYINPPSYAVLEVVAQFMAQKVREHDMRINGKQQLVLADFPDHRYYGKSIPDFGVKYNVITHRSMALKDCPGTTDIDWIVRRGNEILNGDKPLPPAVAEVLRKAEDGMTMFVHKVGKEQAVYEYDALTGALEIKEGFANGTVVAKLHDVDVAKLPVLVDTELNMVNNRADIRLKKITDAIAKAVKG